ncbi:MAG: SLC13 family permease [Peptococcaceae bacterium]|nr:SLC13 family permease [Peptococcaceae bacterium]
MAEKAASKVKWIHLLVMFALMCSGWFLPSGQILTEYGVRVTMIFVGAIWGWIFVGLIEPSLSVLIFLVLAGMGTAKDVVGQGFGAEIILLVVFFSIFTQWLEEIGLTSSMAKWLLSRKMLVGKPYLFIFMLLLVTFLCGFFVGIYATIFLMWGICYRIFNDIGYEKRSKETTFILMGVAYVSIMGMTVKPWSAWSLLGVKGLVTATGLNVTFLTYSTFMVAISLVSVLLFMLAGKFIVRIDVSKLKNSDYTSMGKDIHLTGEQKLGAVLLIVLLVALYIPTVLPDGLLKTILSAQGATGVVIIFTIALSIIHFNGKPTMDFVALASKSIPWNMILLLTAVGPLGTALMSNESGFTKMILSVLKPILAGQSPIVLYVFTIILACVLTQFMNNTILLVVLTPMLCTIAKVVGANPILIAAILIFGLTAALATPGASSRAGLVFGNSEWIDIKQAYVQAILSVVAVIIALIVVGIPLGSALL